MSDVPRETLPPGVLPNITDTDPPPLHPATVVDDGRVWIDETKLHPPAMTTRHPQQEARGGHQEAPQRHR